MNDNIKDDIELVSEILVVKSVDPLLRAKHFKDLQPGDRLIIRSSVKEVGRRGDGASYAPRLRVEFVGRGLEVEKTYNQLGGILEKIEFNWEVITW